MDFIKNIPVSIQFAREIYNHGNQEIKNFLEKYWDKKDLSFDPELGDILSSKKYIVMFKEMVIGSGLQVIYYYDRTKDEIKRASKDTNMFSCWKNFVHANEEDKKLFYSKMIDLV